ncbi:MAG: putative membrane protein EpsK [candidate division WS2 bacterium]|nr:putative membrane protein EpsK [Candidatus Lithacetigena glycinireducens]
MSTKRIVAGTAVSYFNTSVSMLSNLILIPMYLHYLGKEQYGLWLVVLSIVSYLGLSNLGIAQSVSNFVASANAKRDYDGIRAIVATGFWLYVIIVFIAIILVPVAVLLAPLEKLIKVSSSLKNVFTPVLMISSIFFLLQLPLTIFRVTLRSLNLIYKEQFFGIMFTVMQFVGVLVILLFGIGIIGLSVVYGAVGVLSGLILFTYLRSIVPGISVSRKFVNKKLAKELMTPGIYFFILQLSGGLIWGTDNIIISAVLGTAAVAPYAVAFKFFMMSSGIVSVITSNMLPTITSTYALNNKQHLSDIYTNALRLCFGLGFLALFLLISIGPDLMIKWIGIDNYVGNPTFYLFIGLIFVQILLFPSDSILIGTKQHRGYAIMAVFEGIINLLLSLWWIHIWGVAGVAAATLIARLATNGWFMFYRTYTITEVGMKAFLTKIIKPFILPILGTLIMIYILNLMPFLGWYKIILNITSICFIFTSLFYFLSMSRDKRLEIKRLIRGYNGTYKL